MAGPLAPRHACGLQSRENKARQVELAFVRRGAGHEELGVRRVRRHEAVEVFQAHLVGGRPDAGPDGGDHVGGIGAQLFHLLDGGRGDARERALPAGMGGGDDAGFRIGDEDRRAIGGERPADEAGDARDHTIAFLAVGPGPVGDQGIGGVDLVAGDQMFGRLAEVGGGPAAVDLMSGQVPVAFISLPTVMTHWKAGRIRVLAITDSKRSAAAPELPTVGETVKDFRVDNWIGMFAPAGTPRAIIDKLNADITRAIKRREMQERLAGQGFDVVGGTPAEFGRQLQSDIEKYTGVIRAAGIREN